LERSYGRMSVQEVPKLGDTHRPPFLFFFEKLFSLLCLASMWSCGVWETLGYVIWCFFFLLWGGGGGGGKKIKIK